MESERKNEILSDLYAVRAAMSLISENDDGSTSEQESINSKNKRIEECNANINFLTEECRRELYPLQVQTKINELEQEINEIIDKCHNRRQKSIKASFRDVDDDTWGTVCALGFWFAGVPIIFFVIGLFIRGIYWTISYKKYCKRLRLKIEKIKRQISDLQACEKIYLDGTEELVNEKEAERDNKINERKAEIQILKEEIFCCNNKIKLLADCSVSIAQSAQKAYPIIDMRDWGNVDLLIFYFETGRADDIKEALQLVDRQRQTDQLSNAIKMASENICKTVAASVAILGQSLTDSFEKLRMQFGEIKNSLINFSDGVDKSIEKISEERLKSDEMTRALLNKISTSSDKLAMQMDRQMHEVYNLY